MIRIGKLCKILGFFYCQGVCAVLHSHTNFGHIHSHAVLAILLSYPYSIEFYCYHCSSTSSEPNGLKLCVGINSVVFILGPCTFNETAINYTVRMVEASFSHCCCVMCLAFFDAISIAFYKPLFNSPIACLLPSSLCDQNCVVKC